MNKKLPLKNAAKKGLTKVVKKLLEEGVDVCSNDSEALIIASNVGHGKIVKLLNEYINKSKG